METLVKQETTLNNNHSFFESKEHYLNFRQAWKNSIANNYHVRTTWEDYQGGICKNPSKLTSVHHLIYNALRKKDLHKSFQPLVNPRRLIESKFDYRSYTNDVNPYIAFDIARRGLQFAIDGLGYNRPGAIDRLKEPFGETVTNEMLIELNAMLKTIKL